MHRGYDNTKIWAFLTIAFPVRGDFITLRDRPSPLFWRTQHTAFPSSFTLYHLLGRVSMRAEQQTSLLSLFFFNVFYCFLNDGATLLTFTLPILLPFLALARLSSHRHSNAHFYPSL